jgi:hypothetical protein
MEDTSSAKVTNDARDATFMNFWNIRDPREGLKLYEGESLAREKLDEYIYDFTQWLVSVPLKKNPIYDKTGADTENANKSQKKKFGDIFYLPCTYYGHFERRCQVPAGNKILLAIDFDENSVAELPSLLTKGNVENISNLEELKLDDDGHAILRDLCASDQDKMISLEVTFDKGTLYEVEMLTGKLAKLRKSVGPFPLTFEKDNVWRAWPMTGDAYIDGYFLLIQPLTERTNHTIHIRVLEHDVKFEVTYYLTIDDKKTP